MFTWLISKLDSSQIYTLILKRVNEITSTESFSSESGQVMAHKLLTDKAVKINDSAISVLVVKALLIHRHEYQTVIVF